MVGAWTFTLLVILEWILAVFWVETRAKSSAIKVNTNRNAFRYLKCKNRWAFSPCEHGPIAFIVVLSVSYYLFFGLIIAAKVMIYLQSVLKNSAKDGFFARNCEKISRKTLVYLWQIPKFAIGQPPAQRFPKILKDGANVQQAFQKF